MNHFALRFWSNNKKWNQCQNHSFCFRNFLDKSKS